MKKFLAFFLVVLLAVAAWISLSANDLVITVGDSDFDGPFGALLGTLIAGGAMAFVAVILTLVAVLVGFLLAGVGVLVMLALCFAAVVMIAAVSPLLLPVLIPFAIYWFIKRRNRKQALALQHVPA